MSAPEAPKMRRAPMRTNDSFGTPSEPPRALADDLDALDDWLLHPVSPEATGIADVQAPLRRPWDKIDEHRTQQLNVYIPTILHAKLRWVIQSTYGATLKDFVTQALDEAVERSLKEQNDASER